MCIGDADSVLLSPDEVRPAQEDAGIVIHVLIVVTMYYFPAKLSVSETHSPSSSVTIEKNNMKGMYVHVYMYGNVSWSLK